VVAALTLAVLVGGWAVRARFVAVAEPAAAYELVPLPEGVDTLTALRELSEHLVRCGPECTRITYFWTPRMPLSRLAIPHVVEAARALGAEVDLVGLEELERYAATGLAEGIEVQPAGGGALLRARLDEIVAAGALTHAPSLVVHDGANVVGPAILGYKSASAYETMIAERLGSALELAAAQLAAAGEAKETSPAAPAAAPAPAEATYRDYLAVGVPGAYFRWVPGRRAVAYESDRRIYLLDLEDGRNRVAPGSIDFIPTPDGRLFVTPLDRSGLAFYDADEVFSAAGEGRSGAVRPLFVDAEMRDQYPSIGILSEDAGSIRYRVLTSWFRGLLYRDYEVRFGEEGVPTAVVPVGDPVVPCVGMELSTPIMSTDGREVAAREEASGTTKIYTMLDGGRCEEALALGMPTRKVAWSRSGRKIAFSTPRLRSSPDGVGAEPGIFVYDRDVSRLTRVADSEDASQLAFPDFVGDEAVVFMMPGRTVADASYFRVVEPIP